MSDGSDSERWPPKSKRRQTRFLKKHTISSDNHDFVGRVFDLGIVSLSFDSYEQLAQFPDCKYAVDTGYWVENLVRRVESLNLAGDMLWPEPMAKSSKRMPVSRYEWLTIATDVFLVRYASVTDCALLLANQVFQTGLPPRACTIDRLVKAGLPADLVNHLRVMMDEQEQIRLERNARVHHGSERQFTDDTTFKIASLFNDKLHAETWAERIFTAARLMLACHSGRLW